jgi:hypothetical protein
MDPSVDSLSFRLALGLVLGSLVFYLSSALWARLAKAPCDEPLFGFSLTAPLFGDREQLFSIALVSAGTSLSTVFAFFLTATTRFGWWILACPLLFAGGNFLMFRLYARIRALGYFEEAADVRSGASGLIPYLGTRLTGSRTVAMMLLAISLANLLAVLILELTVGVGVLGYLVTGALGLDAPSAPVEFALFAIVLVLLLGYVFVGGFAAVISSDIWQLKIIGRTILITLASVAVLMVAGGRHAPPAAQIAGTALSGREAAEFLVSVTVANLLLPLTQESSWQRFRALTGLPCFNVRRAMRISIVRAAAIWFGLILLGVALRLAGAPGAGSAPATMTEALEAFRSLNDWWFPLAIFPVLAVASLSAMYSTADTCVSAVLYLVDYSWAGGKVTRRDRARLPSVHYLTMAFILVFCLAVFALVRFWFHPTLFQLVFSVFSNLIVIAPTIFVASQLAPVREGTDPARARAITASLALGTSCFWLVAGYAIARGADYEWLSQAAIVPGLVVAWIPILLLKARLRARDHAQPLPQPH